MTWRLIRRASKKNLCWREGLPLWDMESMKPQHLNRRSFRYRGIGVPASFAWYSRSLRLLGGNDAEAFRQNLRAAEQGMHDAVLAMGWFYLNGFGAEKSEQEAFRWYRKSARQGDPRAMFSLGYIAYVHGDFSEALKWFTRAANKQHHRSKCWIGKMYWRLQGGVPEFSPQLALAYRVNTRRSKPDIRSGTLEPTKCAPER